MVAPVFISGRTNHRALKTIPLFSNSKTSSAGHLRSKSQNSRQIPGSGTYTYTHWLTPFKIVPFQTSSSNFNSIKQMLCYILFKHTRATLRSSPFKINPIAFLSLRSAFHVCFRCWPAKQPVNFLACLIILFPPHPCLYRKKMTTNIMITAWSQWIL